MRPYLYVISLLCAVVLWTSCRKDFEYAPSAGNLEFSRDTVYLDTIFSNIGSSTYSFKVYNPTRDDVLIPSIRLDQGQESGYRLNVDGMAGKEFRDVSLLAQDSLFIFIETTFDIANTNETTFLYTDAILFDSGSFLQEVQLVTLVKDAVFLYPNTLTDGTTETITVGLNGDGMEIKVEGFYLSDSQLNFTNEKPYVVYGYAAVPPDKQLRIDSGARVHFHKDSGIYVTEGASLQINGALSTDPLLLENEVVFEGDRLEPEFSDIPGQWGTIWISPGSANNAINYLTIKNATVGLLVEGNGELQSPTLTLNNAQIHNSSSVNLWAKHASILSENTVLGSAGNTSLYCNVGGDYTFIHGTIANYWTQGFRQGTALQIDNFSQSTSEDLINASFTNCIIDGNMALELSLNSNGTNAFNYFFTNCLLKFRDNNGTFSQNPLYDFGNTDIYNQILLNQEIDFINTGDNNFDIGQSSAAIDNANFEAAQAVPFDIKGIDRTTAPDIGAYENTTPE
ncbi:choice-of-anchor Q domain-containing protein [Ulvibacterium sp.]|uniref:choice-of-anchor Q domain-containing protein n=1 Tax=Ulvibacterium sp. TaxID=2665914 RepID=UPI003CC59689